MQTSFKVRGKEYELALQKKERGEEDKFNPFEATVSGQPGGPVTGTLQVTDEALRAAEKASAGGEAPEALLARACGRALASEILIRKLKPEFSFVVDHRWIEMIAAGVSS